MRRRQRGSVMLFVLVMIGMMTIAVLASVELSTSAAILQTKREASMKSRLAFEGAMNHVLTDLRLKKFSVPDQRSYSVGDLDVEVEIFENKTVIPRTIRLVGQTVVNGRVYSFERVVGDRSDPHPSSYAIFINENFDPRRAITINGDLNVNGSIVSRMNPFSVNGDVESSGSTLSFTAAVSGNTVLSAAKVPFPTFSSLSYLAAALITWVTGTVTSIAFGPGVTPKLIYRLGNLSIGGLVTGQGTIFVEGDVTIASDLTYGSASDKLVVITTGKITVANTATNLVGHFFTPVEFITNTGTTRVTSGSIAAQKLTLNGAIDVTHDSYFWNDSSEAVKFRLPGVWP